MSNIETTEFELYLWIEQQKIDYYNNKLSERQIQVLENIPDWTWEFTL